MLLHYLKNNLTNVAPSMFDVTFTNKVNFFISETLANYLYISKNKIETNIDKWDNYKKIINPYEYIHSCVYKSKNSISKLIPISRSFYKLIEFVNVFDLVDLDKDKIETFHLAEGPGGFIEAMIYLRHNSKNEDDIYHGITLSDSKTSVPNWRKLMEKYNHYYNFGNIHLLDGKNNKGNLMDYENLEECCKLYQNKIELITADGGFDFSLNFAEQEVSATKLLFVQIMYAIIMQKKGGHFVIKFFDMFTYPSIELLYILKSFYKDVIITKPNTSRFANSERYIICKNFKVTNSSLFLSVFVLILKDLEKNKEKYISTILNIKIPYYFVSNLEQTNIIIGKQQITTINNTLQLIQNSKSEKIMKIVKNNIEKCVKWCIENNIPFNKNKSENIFLKNRKNIT